MSRKPAPKRRRSRLDKQINFWLSHGLFKVIEREAQKDQRSVQNMLRRLCVEALKERGAFVGSAVQ
jgi:hypothetical protein